MKNRFITVASFQLPQELEKASFFLEKAGIPIDLSGYNDYPIGEMYLEIGQQLLDLNADDAFSFQVNIRIDDIDQPEDMKEDYEIESQEETTLPWKDPDANPVICPQCNSINTFKNLPSSVPEWLNMILFGLPRLLVTEKLQCLKCGAVFL